jgi:D-cysteine desulfhydrase
VLGAIGYVNAGLELAEQVRAGELPEPDAVFVALGTGGTVAGLAAGLALGGLRSRVVGVLVTDLLVPSPARLARLGRAALRRLRRAAPDVPAIALRPDAVRVERAWLGPGYGVPTREAERARAQIADLETTYPAKCLAALLALAREEPWRDRTLLYWDTYSSVDPGAGLAALPEPQMLPAAFHRFFESSNA